MAESAYARRKRLKAEREALEKSLLGERKTFKPKRKRKPMTDEQKAAAAERLRLAREKKRAEQGDVVPKNVHPDVARLPDDDDMSLKNVREWLKETKSELASARQSLKLGAKGAQARVNLLEYYKSSIDRYIQTGDWTHDRFGKNMQGKMQRVCVALAYHHEGPYKGMAKRDVGVVYPDLGGIKWTQEMHNDYYGLNKVEDKPKRKSSTTRRAKRKS